MILSVESSEWLKGVLILFLGSQDRFTSSGPDLKFSVFNLMNSSYEPVAIKFKGLPSFEREQNVIPLFRILSNVLVPVVINHVWLNIHS